MSALQFSFSDPFLDPNPDSELELRFSQLSLQPLSAQRRVFGIHEVLVAIVASCAVPVDEDTETGQPVYALRGGLVRRLMLTSKSCYHAVRSLLLSLSCENCSVRTWRMRCYECYRAFSHCDCAMCTAYGQTSRYLSLPPPALAVWIKYSSADLWYRREPAWETRSQMFMTACRVYMTLNLNVNHGVRSWVRTFFHGRGRHFFSAFNLERLSVIGTNKCCDLAFPQFREFLHAMADNAKCVELRNVLIARAGRLDDLDDPVSSFVAGQYNRLVLQVGPSFSLIPSSAWNATCVRELCIIDYCRHDKDFWAKDMSMASSRLRSVTLIRPFAVPYVNMYVEQLTVCSSKRFASHQYDWKLFLHELRERAVHRNCPVRVMRINFVASAPKLTSEFFDEFNRRDREDVRRSLGEASPLDFDIRVYANVGAAKADGAEFVYTSV